MRFSRYANGSSGRPMGRISGRSAGGVTSIDQMLAPPEVDPSPPDDLVELGRVVEAFGVRGWIKVQAHSQSDTLVRAKSWWLRKHVPAGMPQADPARAQTVRARVLQAKPHGAALVASVSGLSDRDQAEAWRNWSVWLPRSSFPAPEEGEFYWVDLVGCELTVEGGALLGKVVEVLDNGAHAILKVHCYADGASADDPWARDAKGRIRETLVPFVDAYIVSVDIAARRIDSSWPADF